METRNKIRNILLLILIILCVGAIGYNTNYVYACYDGYDECDFSDFCAQCNRIGKCVRCGNCGNSDCFAYAGPTGCPNCGGDHDGDYCCVCGHTNTDHWGGAGYDCSCDTCGGGGGVHDCTVGGCDICPSCHVCLIVTPCQCCPVCGKFICQCCDKCGNYPCTCCPVCGNYPCTCCTNHRTNYGCYICGQLYCPNCETHECYVYCDCCGGNGYNCDCYFCGDCENCTTHSECTCVTYTISYSKNGGSGTTPSSQTVSSSSSITLRTYSGTKTGYDFQGWSKSSTATTATWSSGGTLQGSSLSGDTTLYAVWKPKTYTVSYNVNGGSGSTPSSQTKTYGQTLTLRTYSGTKTGFTFKGWSTSSTATTATYSNGGTMAGDAITANTTLYAVWVIDSYTVSYNVNGGSGSAPSSQTKLVGQTLTLQTYSGTKTGYTFQGWSTSSSTTTATYSSGGTMGANDISANTTLYAVWKPNTYTVAYNVNGGSGSAPSNQSKTYGTPLTLQSYSGTKTGYTYAGWSTSSTATEATWASGGTMAGDAITANTTLYAVWTPNTYTVSYNTNGGGGTAPSSQIKTYGTALTLQTYSGTKTGYTFQGWSTSSTTTTATYTSGGTMGANDISANTTLYAVWTVNTYTVTYDYNGATSGNTEGSKTVTYDSAYGTLPSPGKGKTYTIAFESNGGSECGDLTSIVNSTFNGWYLEETKVTSTTIVKTANDHYLYASWTDSTNGTTINLPTPTKSGYRFDGWCEDIALKGTPKTGTYTPTASRTLFAKWSMVGYPITATAGANGSITPSGVTYVGIGRSQTYIFAANDGYQINSVKVNGVAVDVAGFYTFTNVNAASTIEVTFKAEQIVASDKYTFIKNLDGMSLDTKVKPGTEVTIEYVPQLGYTFDGWVINYGGVKIANPKDLIITFAMPAKPVEITANVTPSS